MQLRMGVSVGQATDALRQRISDSQQVSVLIADADAKRHAYLDWVSITQVHLRTVFSDTEVEEELLKRGYWHICQMSPETAGTLLNRIIDEELVFQVGHPGIHGDLGGCLGEVVARLDTLARLAARPGRICVLDTNALLHYVRFDQLPWESRIGYERIRLVMPLGVIDELDNKKYARREEFQQRAREMLTIIDKYVTESPPDGYASIRDGVTVEVLPGELDHIRMATNDQEILERCEFMHQMTGHPVTLITGDSGMRINAQTRGIDVFKLSANPDHSRDA